MDWILERLFKRAGITELELAEKALRTHISREADPNRKKELTRELAEIVHFKNKKKNDTDS